MKKSSPACYQCRVKKAKPLYDLYFCTLHCAAEFGVEAFEDRVQGGGFFWNESLGEWRTGAEEQIEFQRYRKI